MANDTYKVKILKHSFTQTDMFDHLKMVHSIGLKHHITHDLYGCDSYKFFCGKVFAYFLFLVILDIIENNIIFVFPRVREFHCKLRAELIEQDAVDLQRKRGRFEGIDFFNTLGKAYKIVFTHKFNNVITNKSCFLNKELRDAFYSKINSGKQYG